MDRKSWIDTCNRWKNQWPVYDANMHANDEDGINIYEVLECISVNLTAEDIVMADAGSPSYSCPTNLKAQVPGQFIFNPSQADMGWAVPASVGVSLAAENKSVTVVVGDGSFYSNMQELAVIRHHSLPVTLFVLNNDGYLSIRNTQSKYHGNRVWGVDSDTGLTFPPLSKVAETFGFNYKLIATADELRKHCGTLMHAQWPTIVEVICLKHQEILPAQAFKTLPDGSRLQAPLHDMYPFIPEEEISREWPGS